MQIRPFSELEAAARERYRQKFASVPAPTLINLEALVTFAVPRVLEWRGVGYRAPPLPYQTGLRLQVAAQALQELTSRGAPEASRRAAARVAARVVATLLRPRAPWRVAWRRRLRTSLLADLDAFQGLLWWLIHVPDQGVVPPATRAVTVDCMDTLTDFVREFPRWVGADGFPLTWAHFQYGVRHLGRARARADLRMAVAARAAGSTDKGWKEWETEWLASAGWLHG